MHFLSTVCLSIIIFATVNKKPWLYYYYYYYDYFPAMGQWHSYLPRHQLHFTAPTLLFFASSVILLKECYLYPSTQVGQESQPANWRDAQLQRMYSSPFAGKWKWETQETRPPPISTFLWLIVTPTTSAGPIFNIPQTSIIKYTKQNRCEGQMDCWVLLEINKPWSVNVFTPHTA